MITAHYITVSGIRTFYETNDAGAFGTIVCLHSEGRETRQFHRLMEALEPSYRVVAFDMPGHGKTWPVGGRYPISEWKEYVEFAWSFLECMELQNAVLLGCGLGAAAAFDIAQRHLASGIVAVGGSDEAVWEMDETLINHPHVSTPHMVQEYNRSITGRAADAQARELICWQSWCETGITSKEDLKMLREMDLRAGMAKVTCPVLMIRGEDDWVVDQAMAERTLGRIGSQNKKLVTFEKTGRFAMLEQPGRTAGEITAFF